jgi:hypothetical protein
MNQISPELDMLRRNLEALGARSRKAVDAVLAATPARVEFATADDGGVTGVVGDGQTRRQLASRRAPLDEAKRLVATVDVVKSAAVVVLGFGLGHHVAELATAMKKTGLIVVFEPDAALLRAVFERVDCVRWLREANVAVLTDPADTGAIAEVVPGFEGVLATGTVFLQHPPSMPRLGTGAGEFERTFTTVMKAVRTAVLTTMVQVGSTVRNLLQNAGSYAVCPGIADLENARAGMAAVVVSAGPSLHRNIERLSDPAVRSRVVVIAVQTVLKTLLARGIKPDFVTALDYHEISKRFYEGLSAKDVDGVTLVVEPKANPAIIDAFPGRIRMVGDQVLDDVMGEELARPMGKLKPGATVAHLAYYLARHMGCDPVIFIGQDLGFTDNQYYAPGAAIHRVWSGELNDFNTIEMLEWQRIVRMRNLLRRVPAQAGGEIYTDEQMATYQVQFERDFLDDTRRGLRVIDATEGGTLKRHTTVMTLADALASLPAAHHAPIPTAERLDPSRVAKMKTRASTLRSDVARLEYLSTDTARKLEGMLAESSDAKVNSLISEVHRNASAVAALGTAHRLVQFINQTGQLNRFRSDRAIQLDSTLSPRERQRAQMERDLKNVRWLAEAARHMGSMLEDCERALAGGPKVTRDADVTEPGERGRAAPVRVVAAVTVDLACGGLSTPRDLLAPVHGNRTALDEVLRCLKACPGIDAVAVVCRDASVLRPLVTEADGVEFLEAGEALWNAHERHTHAVGAARALARHCWRGGIANLSCYDEAMCAPLVAGALGERNVDAVVIAGADWCELDASIVEQTVARFRENPERNSVTFSQSPPGKGVCVVSAEMLCEMGAVGGLPGTIGFLLGYHPLAPQADPIAKPACVQVDAALRDSLRRFVPDSAARRVNGAARTPTVLAISLETGKRAPMATHLYDRLFAAWAQAVEDGAVTIDASKGEVALGRTLVQLAKANGVPHTHVRIGLDAPDAILLAGADATTIHCGTDTSESTARTLFERLERVEPTQSGRMPTRWFVPTITRCDASLDGIEAWYDFWLRARGAAVIEPRPDTATGERIAPMPVPENLREHSAATRLTVLRCGLVKSGDGVVGDLAREGILAILERMGTPLCEGGRAPDPIATAAGALT